MPTCCLSPSGDVAFNVHRCSVHYVRLTPHIFSALHLAIFEQPLLKEHSISILVRPVGFEPTTNRFEVCDSIQLSYGRSFPTIINGVSEGT